MVAAGHQRGGEQEDEEIGPFHADNVPEAPAIFNQTAQPTWERWRPAGVFPGLPKLAGETPALPGVRGPLVRPLAFNPCASALARSGGDG